MDIELKICRDGMRWDCPFQDTAFIAHCEQAFSNGGIFANSPQIILDDTIRFYYARYKIEATVLMSMVPLR